MSFLDLLLAEAIAAGLAREAARERPPENFFVLPREPRAWRMFQAASKKETMVVAIEVTNNLAPNCRAVQPLFIELARKFSSVPFLRVEIGLGRTYDELRDDLGGVQYTPTILIVLFNDDKKKIAQIEGTDKIRAAIRSGAAEAIISAFMEERVKLRMAERLAEQMALRLALGMAVAGATGAGAAAAARRRREEQLKEQFEKDMERQIEAARGAQRAEPKEDEDDKSDDQDSHDRALQRLMRGFRLN
jgi:thiol-disulfide isomerase/thioredoxin